jgi:GNAT superfamily N-acetyltransferase
MLVQLDGSHRELIYRIREHAEQYVAVKDTDQYQAGIDPLVVRKNLDRQIDSGQFYGWRTDDGRIVAVAALTEPDPDYWTAEEKAEPQTYIGRLYVAEDAHGKGYGSAMLHGIDEHARARGDRWMRLNCWTTNTRLHAYYQAHGFEHVRTTYVPGRMSGALFQRAPNAATP